MILQIILISKNGFKINIHLTYKSKYNLLENP